MAAQNGTQMFTVDKFLGINESGDGDTELKLGEASRMENFTITDAYNLALRPGVRRVDFNLERDPAPLLSAWAGFLEEEELLILCDFAGGHDRLFIYKKTNTNSHELIFRQEGVLGLTTATDAIVHIFTFNGLLYVMSNADTAVYDGESFVKTDP